jgi:hypothetical protein
VQDVLECHSLLYARSKREGIIRHLHRRVVASDTRSDILNICLLTTKQIVEGVKRGESRAGLLAGCAKDIGIGETSRENGPDAAST